MALQLCEVPVSTWESRSSSGHNLPIAWCPTRINPGRSETNPRALGPSRPVVIQTKTSCRLQAGSASFHLYANTASRRPLIACSHLIMNRCTLRQQQSQNFRLTSMVIRQQCSHKTATYSLKTRHPTRWQLWCARHPDFVARSSAAMSHLAHKATHLSASRDMQ